MDCLYAEALYCNIDIWYNDESCNGFFLNHPAQVCYYRILNGPRKTKKVDFEKVFETWLFTVVQNCQRWRFLYLYCFGFKVRTSITVSFSSS